MEGDGYMHKTLWVIIKNLSDLKELSSEELALAEAILDRDEFLIFKDQMEGKLKMSNEQWI